MTKEIDRDHSTFAVSAVRLYGAQLHRYLVRRLARPQDADDLAQEVLMRLLRLDKPELVRKPQAYLFSVAANLVREFALRNHREYQFVTYDSDMAQHCEERQSDAPLDMLSENLNIELQLERALAELPAMQRAVLIMVKRDGLSHKEVAKITRLNVRTVERYVMEAVAKMMTMNWDR